MFSIPAHIRKLHDEYVKTHGSENAEEMLVLMVEQYSELRAEQEDEDDYFSPYNTLVDLVIEAKIYNPLPNDPWFNHRVEMGSKVVKESNKYVSQFFELVADQVPLDEIEKQLNITRDESIKYMNWTRIYLRRHNLLPRQGAPWHLF